jgi:hypothetical protein
MSKTVQSPRRQARTNSATEQQGHRTVWVTFSARAAASRHRRRRVLIATEVVLGSLFITGCNSGTSAVAEVQLLIQQHPWLARLAFAFLEGLVGALGGNVGLILRTAAAALLVGA